MTTPGNLFALPARLPAKEVTEVLLQRTDVRVERVLSAGQASPPDFWYDQAEDEWVSVLQGSAALQWEDGSLTAMHPGDWLLIPAHRKHRVERSSIVPPCIWLAIFMRPSELGR